jgi:putative salt-induced outer membrane protein
MKFSTLATLISAAIACMATGSVFAQAKTDGQWRGLAGASVSTTSGNSTSSNVLLNVDMARLTAADKITTGAFVNYGTTKVAGTTTTNNNKWGLAGQYDYNLTPRLYAFGKMALEGDQVIKLSNRRTLGAGLGYKVINETATTFDVFGGVANIHSKYSQNRLIGNTTSDRFSTNSLLLGEESTHKISDAIFFKQRVELYPRISGDGGTFAKGTANLGVSLNSAMSLNVGLVNDYNSAPGVGRKKNDLALFTGISVKLGN